MSGGPPIVFPSNPTVGQTFTAQGTTWMWNGTAWVNANTSANFLPLTGGTISPGPLGVSGNLSASGTLSVGGATTLAGGQANRVFNIQGVTDGSNAPAGMVGEIIIATGGPFSMTTGVALSPTVISLTAGEWDVWGQATINPTSGGTNLYAVISTTPNTTSPTLPAGAPALVSQLVGGAGITFSSVQLPLAAVRVAITATTSVYINTLAVFSSGSSTTTGILYARRAR